MNINKQKGLFNIFDFLGAIIFEICEIKSVKIIFFDYRLLSSRGRTLWAKNIFLLLAAAINGAVTVYVQTDFS